MAFVCLTRPTIFKSFTLAFSFLFIFVVASRAEQPKTPDVVSSGISLSQYPDFEKKWQLITARYRQDTREMRFVYANTIAVQALRAHVLDYPDGAVFIKIGVATEDDPAFISSSVPLGAKRYQIMLRNRARYVDTDGWGYALFNGEGKELLSESFQKMSKECQACHQLVPQRGYVFSQIMDLSVNKPSSDRVDTPAPILQDSPPRTVAIQFTTLAATALADKIRREIPPDNYKEVRLLQGHIPDHVFSGTVDEIRPTLIKETLRTSHPALMISSDAALFSLVFEDKKAAPCLLPNGQAGTMLRFVYTDEAQPPGQLNILRRASCQ